MILYLLADGGRSICWAKNMISRSLPAPLLFLSRSVVQAQTQQIQHWNDLTIPQLHTTLYGHVKRRFGIGTASEASDAAIVRIDLKYRRLLRCYL